jgi:hypothetical protein
LKLESLNQKEAIEEAKNKARELWSVLAVYKPYAARIINEITSEKIKLI